MLKPADSFFDGCLIDFHFLNPSLLKTNKNLIKKIEFSIFFLYAYLKVDILFVMFKNLKERSSRAKDKVRMCRSRPRYYNLRTVLIFLLYFGTRLQSNQSDQDYVRGYGVTTKPGIGLSSYLTINKALFCQRSYMYVSTLQVHMYHDLLVLS